MDFWEGAILGSFWSDAEYVRHRHRGMALGYSVLLILGLLFLLYRQNISDQVYPIGENFNFWLKVWSISIPIGFVLSYFYHRIPRVLRPLILVLLGMRTLLSMVLVWSYVTPLLKFKLNEISDWAMRLIDGPIVETINQHTDRLHLRGMILAGGVIVLRSFGYFLLGTLVIVLVPIIYFKLYRLIQRTFDAVVLAGINIAFKFSRRRSKKESRVDLSEEETVI